MDEIEDYCADIQMYFQQIVALATLLIENGTADEVPNLLTVRELAESGLGKVFLLKKEITNS